MDLKEENYEIIPEESVHEESLVNDEDLDVSDAGDNKTVLD